MEAYPKNQLKHMRRFTWILNAMTWGILMTSSFFVRWERLSSLSFGRLVIFSLRRFFIPFLTIPVTFRFAGFLSAESLIAGHRDDFVPNFTPF
jgi:hypothetical protein